MFRTLRSRLVLSHLLPLLVVIPLMGLGLIYTVETQILLPDLLNELEGQAQLVVELARAEPDLWSNPVRAQAFVAQLGPRVEARLMLLDGHGLILASSAAADAGRIGQRLAQPTLDTVLAGQRYARNGYSTALNGEIADVLIPVMGADQHVAGVVRLSYLLPGYRRFVQLRYIVIGVLVLGILVGVALGEGLAYNLQRPLQQVTEAMEQLGTKAPLQPLPEREWEEINRLVRSFNALVERTRNLEISRQHLLANLVHELGRPLGALASAIEALRGGAMEQTELRDDLLQGMEEGVRRLCRLLEDLARLHEETLGMLEMNCQPVALSDWLTQVLGLWRAAAVAKQLQWHITVPSDLPTINADPDRLAQALGNLLNNAIQYTPAAGTVSVTAGAEAETVWIRVSDTGPGIAPDSLSRIFERFYRGQTGRRFPQGMGLGLAIARDLVTAHGGRIEVESQLSVGSRFTLWLPRSIP